MLKAVLNDKRMRRMQTTLGVGSMELRLAYPPARLAKKNVVVRVRIKWRIEINKIDTRIRELAPVAQPLQIVAEIEAVHAIMFIVTSSGALLALQLRHTQKRTGSEFILMQEAVRQHDLQSGAVAG